MPPQNKWPEHELRRRRQEIQQQLDDIEDQIDNAPEGEDVSDLEAEYEQLRQELLSLLDQEHQARRTRIDEKKQNKPQRGRGRA